MHNVKREFKVPFGIIGPIIVSLIYASIVGVWIATSPGAIKNLNISLSLIL